MYLHIGSNHIVLIREIVAILDYKIENFKITKEFIANSKETISTLQATDENVSSIIVTNTNGKNIMYFSSISVGTLQKRVANLYSDSSFIASNI